MIKEPLKYLKIDSWESIGDHLVDIGKTIGSFVLYILKAYLLMTIIHVVIFAIWSLIVYIDKRAIFEGRFWETVAGSACYMGIIGPMLNIRVILALFFYRFNNVEIISVTCLFLLMFTTGIIYNDDFINSWPIISLMLLYIVLKKIIVKLYFNRNGSD